MLQLLPLQEQTYPSKQKQHSRTHEQLLKLPIHLHDGQHKLIQQSTDDEQKEREQSELDNSSVLKMDKPFSCEGMYIYMYYIKYI